MMTAGFRKLLPTNAWVRAAIVPALVFIAMVTNQSYLADFWHHLARGRAIVSEGQIVDRDLFTFTVPGRSFQDSNWLTQLFYYQLFDWGGLDLVRTVNALALAVALGLLVAICRRRSGSLGVAAAVCIFVFFGLWQVLTIRPQTFSLLLFVLLYDLLDRSESRPGWLLIVPFVMALWANLHPAFPAGIMLIGCFLLASAWQGWRGGRLFRDAPAWRLGTCLAAGLLATLLNPYGFGIYRFIRHNSSISAARQIDEWGPPSLDLWISRLGLVSLVAMVCLLLASRLRLGRRPSARDVILLVCFLVPACLWLRMVAWWLLVSAPIAAVLLVALFPRFQEGQEGQEPAWDAMIVFAAILALVVLSLPGLQRFNPLLAARHATPRIEDEIEEIRAPLANHASPLRIFSRFEWGEYLTWAFSPECKVFMDGRIEIYPDDVWEQYDVVTRGNEGWQKILDDYRVDVLVLDAGYHRKTGLLPRVEASSAWESIHRSANVLLYVRKRNVGLKNHSNGLNGTRSK